MKKKQRKETNLAIFTNPTFTSLRNTLLFFDEIPSEMLNRRRNGMKIETY